VARQGAGSDRCVPVTAPLEADFAGGGVVFRRPWTSPRPQPWEGLFADPNERLPQAPEVAAQRRAAQRRWRERQRARGLPKLAAERDDAAGDDVAA
jgi:hypothetical protein